jgi:hypothetical protein
VTRPKIPLTETTTYFHSIIECGLLRVFGSKVKCREDRLGIGVKSLARCCQRHAARTAIDEPNT